jgi:fluoride ion exporter CrcB/FEX
VNLDRRELAAIFAGGFVGAVARAELVTALPAQPGRWPWATFIVNIAGAFLVGYEAQQGGNQVEGLHSRKCSSRQRARQPSSPAGSIRRF